VRVTLTGVEALRFGGDSDHRITDGPKEYRDVTEGIIILLAVTHCYLFTSLTEKGDLLAGITVFT